jgi:hypothetical protein
LVVGQTYLYTTRPSLGDPREHMHRAALQGLRMVGNKLTAKDEEAYRNKGTHKPRSPHRHNNPRHRSSSRRSRSASPKYHKSPRRGGTRRSRTPTRAYDYEDAEKEMGASCFTRRVRTTLVPNTSEKMPISGAPIRSMCGAYAMRHRCHAISKNISVAHFNMRHT